MLITSTPLEHAWRLKEQFEERLRTADKRRVGRRNGDFPSAAMKKQELHHCAGAICALTMLLHAEYTKANRRKPCDDLAVRRAKRSRQGSP